MCFGDFCYVNSLSRVACSDMVGKYQFLKAEVRHLAAVAPPNGLKKSFPGYACDGIIAQPLNHATG